MNNSDSAKNWEHGPGAPGWYPSPFLETPAESGLDERGIENYDTLN